MKRILGSSIDEGASSTSETKHDRRTLPKPKLFISAERLEKTAHNLGSILSSSLDECDFFSCATKLDRSWKQDAESHEIVNFLKIFFLKVT
jgi:hypothetical protein